MKIWMQEVYLSRLLEKHLCRGGGGGGGWVGVGIGSGQRKKLTGSAVAKTWSSGAGNHSLSSPTGARELILRNGCDLDLG